MEYGQADEHGDFRASRDARRLCGGRERGRSLRNHGGETIQALEAHLGSRLLNRTTRHQRLTEVGEVYYERCRKLLSEVDAADSSVSRLACGTSRDAANRGAGDLRYSAVWSRYGEYLRQFPDVNVDLSLNDRVVDLIDEGFEVAIRVGHLKDSQLIARDSIPMRACCAPPLSTSDDAAGPKTPQDLHEHDCLGFSFRESEAVGAWCKPLKITP